MTFPVPVVLNVVIILRQLLPRTPQVANAQSLLSPCPALEACLARSYVYEAPLATLPGKRMALAIALTGIRPPPLNGLYRKEVMLPYPAVILRTAKSILNPTSLVLAAIGTP